MNSHRTQTLRQLVKEARDMGVRFRTIHVIDNAEEKTTVTMACYPLGVENEIKSYEVALTFQSLKDKYNKLEGQVRAAGRLNKANKSMVIGVKKGQRVLDAAKDAIISYIQKRNIHDLIWVRPENLV